MVNLTIIAKMLSMKFLGILGLTLTSTLSLIQCPHSKVEESFNLQATYDLYYFDFRDVFNEEMASMNFDHLHYGGVVPRTFLGPMIISIILKSISFVLQPFIRLQDNPLLLQFLARATLLSFNLHAHHRLAKAANMKFGKKDFHLGGCFLLLTASQFHIPFYSSRMLPNSFALAIVTHSYADWLSSNISRAVALMVFCTTVFRCDVVILLFTFGVTLLIRREISIIRALKVGLGAAIISLILTVPLDSIMWRRPLWPEGEVLLFNTLENKSSEYGVSHWSWYFVKALPKGLMFALFLVPMAFLRIPECIIGFKVSLLDLEALPYFLPAIGFIALYSILPHKEIRFIFISFPIFNIMAAKAFVRIHDAAKIICSGDLRRKKMMASRLMISILYAASVFSVCLSLLASVIFIHVSKSNYPGGDALASLSREIDNSPPTVRPVNIFIDVASTMTGVSLFGQRALANKCKGKGCKMLKDGYEEENGVYNVGETFDYILSEESDHEGYDHIDIIPGFPTIDLRQRTILTTDAIYVLKKKNWN